MSVPNLKQFNRLLDSAAAEVAAWSRSPAAAGVHPDRLSYLQDTLAAIQGSVSVGSVQAAADLVLGTVESLGVPVSAVSPSLERLRELLAERARKQR